MNPFEKGVIIAIMKKRIMEAPYIPCCIEGCTKVITDKHHAPGRPHLKREHKDDPRFHRYLCRFHHRQRTDYGLHPFKMMYPGYEEVTLEGYNRICRELLTGSSKDLPSPST